MVKSVLFFRPIPITEKFVYKHNNTKIENAMKTEKICRKIRWGKCPDKNSIPCVILIEQNTSRTLIKPTWAHKFKTLSKL